MTRLELVPRVVGSKVLLLAVGAGSVETKKGLARVRGREKLQSRSRDRWQVPPSRSKGKGPVHRRLRPVNRRLGDVERRPPRGPACRSLRSDPQSARPAVAAAHGVENFASGASVPFRGDEGVTTPSTGLRLAREAESCGSPVSP